MGIDFTDFESIQRIKMYNPILKLTLKEKQDFGNPIGCRLVEAESGLEKTFYFDGSSKEEHAIIKLQFQLTDNNIVWINTNDIERLELQN